MIGWFPTAVILKTIQSSLFRWVAPSEVRWHTVLLLLCFMVVGIPASRKYIPSSLLILLGWCLTWIASLTLHVYQWGSRSINFTSFQSRWCPLSRASSETTEVQVRASRMSRSCSCSLILSFIDLQSRQCKLNRTLLQATLYVERHHDLVV